MAEFAFDVSALVLPPVAPPTLPPPAPHARPSARFEDHLGQASRPPRDDAADSSRNSYDRPTESASSATQAPADSERAASGRDRDDHSPERKDGDDVAADASATETADEDVSTKETTTDAAAVAAAAAAQASEKSPSKKAIKRGAAGLDAEVNALGGKAANAAEAARGKTGKKTRESAKEHDAELNAPAESVEVKEAVKEAADDEQSPVEKSLGSRQKSAADTATDLAGDAKANPGAAQVAVETQRVGVADATAVKSTDTATDVQPADTAAASDASPKRGRGKSDEFAARDNLQRPPSQEGAAATAPAGTTVGAVPAISGDEGDSAEQKERSPQDAQPADRNDKNEPRIGAAPALLAARSEKGHEANGRADGLTEAERARFVQRVASAFRSFGDQGGEVRLRLSPPELGSLRVELTVRDGVLSARLEAETSAARNLLLDNLPALRERLAEQNIKVEKFDVDVRDERRQSSGEQFTGQPDQGRQGDRQRGRTFDNRPITAAAVARATRAPIKHGDASELNIVI